MFGRDSYDVSATERKVLEARHARRTKLRHEYLKQIGNPYRMATGEGGTVFDSGLQRFLSMRAKGGEYFRPTTKVAIFPIFGVILPSLAFMYLIINDRNEKENRYRTGQVSYADRRYKFT